MRNEKSDGMFALYIALSISGCIIVNMAEMMTPYPECFCVVCTNAGHYWRDDMACYFRMAVALMAEQRKEQPIGEAETFRKGNRKKFSFLA
ncbi:hypothetical protein [Parageobacillus thermoglucosidasius]|uniref:hypothetical protein n=2 Tax=Parageobacillus thermoglucosidasius TaxID=1426 RepID=UPI00031E584C|nr:hypothetical protein [Parageobacillus thermoglucosidasius]KYD16570.1 hypothetical protein B4168_1074 [Anoxybacillus flavithermus]OAO88283.1 hypothetical protein GT23_0559 [Parageobacillus thermoglucosidasius]